MATFVGIGLDQSEEGRRCGRRAAQEALAGLRDRPPSLALLFTSHAQPDQVLKGAVETLGDVPLIGATSAGEYTHQGYVEGGAGLLLIHSSDILFHPLAHHRQWFSGGSLLGKLQGVSERGLGSRHNQRTLILFPDDRSMNLDQVVDRAMTETAMLYTILGGPGPTRPEPPRRPAVFHNRQLIRAGLAGAEFLSQHPLGLGMANGWQPAGGPYRVTRVDDRRVIQIDGRPAREVYEDFVRTQGQSVDELSADLVLKFPIGIAGEGDYKVSVVMGFDSSGAILVTSPPPKNSLIHILRTAPDALVAAAGRALDQAFEGLDRRDPAGALFVDCMSTAMALGEAADQQRAAVRRALGEVPFLGFRSHGVLARLPGQTAGHYECAVATCVLPG